MYHKVSSQLSLIFSFLLPMTFVVTSLNPMDHGEPAEPVEQVQPLTPTEMAEFDSWAQKQIVNHFFRDSLQLQALCGLFQIHPEFAPKPTLLSWAKQLIFGSKTQETHRRSSQIGSYHDTTRQTESQHPVDPLLQSLNKRRDHLRRIKHHQSLSGAGFIESLVLKNTYYDHYQALFDYLLSVIAHDRELVTTFKRFLITNVNTNFGTGTILKHVTRLNKLAVRLIFKKVPDSVPLIAFIQAFEGDDFEKNVTFFRDPGATIEQEDEDGRRPLHVAAQEGNLAATKWLVSNGADIHAWSELYGTPLAAAVESRIETLDVIKFLLAHGAHTDVNRMSPAYRNQNGDEIPEGTLIHNVIHHGWNKRGEILTVLSANGGVATQNDLVDALMRDYDTGTIQWALSQGVDVHSTNTTGQTAFYHHLALLAAHIIDWQINQYLDGEPEPPTPYSYAVVPMLLEHGAITDVPAALKIRNLPRDLKQFLLAAQTIHSKALYGDEAAVKSALDAYVPANIIDERRRTPLHHAAAGGNPAVVKLLLSQRDYDRAESQAVDACGKKPIDYALHDDIISLLRRAKDERTRAASERDQDDESSKDGEQQNIIGSRPGIQQPMDGTPTQSEQGEAAGTTELARQI